MSNINVRLVDLMKQIEKLESQAPEAKKHSFTCAGLKVGLFGAQVCFSDDGDFMSLEQAREFVQDLAATFGGKVKWEAKGGAQK